MFLTTLLKGSRSEIGWVYLVLPSNIRYVETVEIFCSPGL